LGPEGVDEVGVEDVVRELVLEVEEAVDEVADVVLVAESATVCWCFLEVIDSATIRPAVTTSTPTRDSVTIMPVLDRRGRNGDGWWCHGGRVGGPTGGAGGMRITIGGGATAIGGGKPGGG
jgi:hypothetical protein